MAAKKSDPQMVICPVGKFFMDIENVFGKKSDFSKYMTRSRIEFLKAMRALLDEHIDDLEKKKTIFQVPVKVLHSACHLLVSVMTTVHASFLLDLQPVQTLYTSVSQGVINDLSMEVSFQGDL